MRRVAYQLTPPQNFEGVMNREYRVGIPPSKSISNRALIIAALGEGSFHLKNLLECGDTICMAKALKSLGVAVQGMGPDLLVHGTAGKLIPYEENLEIDVKMAGTTSRFLMALTLLLKENIIFRGEGRLPQRPFAPLFKVLRNLGKKVEILGNQEENSLPVRISGAMVTGGKEVEISGKETGQFLSALLMVAPLLEKGLTIKVTDTIASRSYVEMTIEVMKAFGVSVTVDGQVFVVQGGQRYRRSIGVYVVEGDWSSASYFLTMGALSKDLFVLQGLVKDSLQGDARYLDFLQKLGVEIHFDDLELKIKKSNQDQLKKEGDAYHLQEMPDLAPTLILLLSMIPGRHRLTGLYSLKWKESDRLQVLIQELNKISFYLQYNEREDLLLIEGKKFEEVDFFLKSRKTPILLESYDDHRMVMVFSILGRFFPNIVISDPGVVDKSYPQYWNDYLKVGGYFQEFDL